jgi:hypothetical protein
VYDVFKSNTTQRAYVVVSEQSTQDATSTDWEAACGADRRFVDHGYADGRPERRRDERALPRDRLRIRSGGRRRPRRGGDGNEVEVVRGRRVRVAARPGVRVDRLDPRELDLRVELQRLRGARHLARGVGSHHPRPLHDGARPWTFSSDPNAGDWKAVEIADGIAGPATFDGQHDVHPVAGNTS